MKAITSASSRDRIVTLSSPISMSTPTSLSFEAHVAAVEEINLRSDFDRERPQDDELSDVVEFEISLGPGRDGKYCRGHRDSAWGLDLRFRLNLPFG